MHLEFAKIYDKFTAQVDYNSWYKFLRQYFKKEGTLLDAGCGTGILSILFEKDNFNVTAIDISSEMLNVFSSKNTTIEKVNASLVNYINQDKFNYIMCNFDTINYLNSEIDFINFLHNSYLNLKDDGMLIFDIVEEGIFEEMFHDDLFIDSNNEYTTIWLHEELPHMSTQYEKKHKINIEIFNKVENNLYEKYEEEEIKTIFNTDRLIEIINNTNFEIYDTARNSQFGESRIYFILKKINGKIIGEY